MNLTRQHYTVLALRAVLLAAWTIVAMTPLSARVDQALTVSVQRMASPVLDVGLSLVTIAGNVEVTVGLALLIGITLVRSGRIQTGVTLWGVFVGGSAAEWIGKHWLPHAGVLASLQRSRLNILHYVVHTPYAYPSGHAFRTLLLAVAAGIAWWPLAGRVSGPIRYAPAAAAGLMGLALVYLGDHWASEVVGGYLLAILCIWPISAVAAASTDRVR